MERPYRMVFIGVSKRKDLLGGPTNPSPHVGGALAPNDWGINSHPPYSTTPCGSDNMNQVIKIYPRMGCPTHKGLNGGGGAGFVLFIQYQLQNFRTG